MDTDITKYTTSLPYNNLTQDEFDDIMKVNNGVLLDSPINIRCRFIPADIVFPEYIKYISFIGCMFENREFRNTDFDTCEFIMCDLSYTMFTNCNFRSTAFSYTNMYSCGFVECGFNMGWFNLVNMNGSRLAYTNFNGVSLYNSTFDISKFSNCKFDATDYEHCHFTRTTFVETNISIESHVPDTGSFIGWKKACIRCEESENDEYYIVKLRIPDDARRSNAGQNKCRADKAYVEDIQDLDGNSVDKVVESMWNCAFKYQKGQIVTEPNFCENRFEECAKGIHFFLNRDDAVNFTM